MIREAHARELLDLVGDSRSDGELYRQRLREHLGVNSDMDALNSATASLASVLTQFARDRALVKTADIFDRLVVIPSGDNIFFSFPIGGEDVFAVSHGFLGSGLINTTTR